MQSFICAIVVPLILHYFADAFPQYDLKEISNSKLLNYEDYYNEYSSENSESSEEYGNITKDSESEPIKPITDFEVEEITDIETTVDLNATEIEESKLKELLEYVVLRIDRLLDKSNSYSQIGNCDYVKALKHLKDYLLKFISTDTFIDMNTIKLSDGDTIMDYDDSDEYSLGLVDEEYLWDSLSNYDEVEFNDYSDIESYHVKDDRNEENDLKIEILQQIKTDDNEYISLKNEDADISLNNKQYKSHYDDENSKEYLGRKYIEEQVITNKKLISAENITTGLKSENISEIVTSNNKFEINKEEKVDTVDSKTLELNKPIIFNNETSMQEFKNKNNLAQTKKQLQYDMNAETDITTSSQTPKNVESEFHTDSFIGHKASKIAKESKKEDEKIYNRIDVKDNGNSQISSNKVSFDQRLKKISNGKSNATSQVLTESEVSSALFLKDLENQFIESQNILSQLETNYTNVNNLNIQSQDINEIGQSSKNKEASQTDITGTGGKSKNNFSEIENSTLLNKYSSNDTNEKHGTSSEPIQFEYSSFKIVDVPTNFQLNDSSVHIQNASLRQVNMTEEDSKSQNFNKEETLEFLDYNFLSSEFIETNQTSKGGEYLNFNRNKTNILPSTSLHTPTEDVAYNNAIKKLYNTILEYLYDHSNSSLILSLKNKSKFVNPSQ